MATTPGFLDVLLPSIAYPQQLRDPESAEE